VAEQDVPEREEEKEEEGIYENLDTGLYSDHGNNYDSLQPPASRPDDDNLYTNLRIN
jgi:hypothetical protein